MKQQDKYYCIYCGQDKNKEHYKECPIVSGIPEMVFGIPSRENDILYNLYLGRFSQLWTLREQGLGTGDKERDRKLAFEDVHFTIHRFMLDILILNDKADNFFFGFFARHKIKKYKKSMRDVGYYAGLKGVTKEELNKATIPMIESNNIIPLYRNKKTLDLEYVKYTEMIKDDNTITRNTKD